MSFTSVNPATGAVVGRWPDCDEADVAAAVSRARAAAGPWWDLGFDGRRRLLDAWRGHIARGLEDLVALVHAENGKPCGDVVLETAVALDHLAWAAVHAGRVLRSRRVRAGLLAANHAASVEYHPFGVVGVIGPWNYPVLTPMSSLAAALAAGNAVVFKPSEFTPGVGAWLAERWRDAAPPVPDVLQVLTGGPETGAALCRAEIDKLAFTGSTATGREVMASCAQNLVPVVLECGGKDALLVDGTADLKAAADAALWGAMSNAGQTCLGIERVYATEEAYEPFVAELSRRARRLRPGSDPDADYGPITTPGQVDVIHAHVTDALAREGRAVTGGTVAGPWIPPTILLDVPEDSLAIREETFGPTVTVTPVRDTDEAVARANAGRHGLGGAVFTGSGQSGVAIARRLRSGMTSVNSVLTFASVPGLPLGGVGHSGFGRVHGPDGLREFARTKAMTRQRFPLPVPLSSFSRPGLVDRLLAVLIRVRHGRR